MRCGTCMIPCAVMYKQLSTANLHVARKYKHKICWLPDSNVQDSAEAARCCATAKAEVEGVSKSSLSGTSTMKRGKYSFYDTETRVKIARCANAVGVTAAAAKFLKELDRSIKYTTVQSVRVQFRRDDKSWW